MKKTTTLWRGLLAIVLSLTVALSGLTGVAVTWRSVIDGMLGTASTITTNDDKFTSDYKTTDELVAAHIDLGERVAEEGVVLLKNENAALPLTGDAPKVTLFGMGAIYPFMGGTMGSSISGATQRDLVAALQERGYEVNPVMLEIYQTMGTVKTGESQGWGGVTPIYGYRPANFATPYEPSEPSVEAYTAPAEEMGAGADPSYVDSFKDYNDAAIVVFSRPGSEGSDYYPGAAGIDQEKYEATSALGLVKHEREVLELAKANFDTVIVMINSGSTMEIEELKQDDEVDAIMYIGFPGAYGFLGIADLLNGKANFSGHLADTYAVDIAMSPAAQNFGKIALSDLSAIVWEGSLMGDIPATSPLGSFGGSASMAADHYIVQAEGIYTGYKYYETRYYDSVVGQGNASSKVGASKGASSWVYDNEVSYTFGYGLSYTTFEQTIESVKVDLENETITAVVNVKNTGDVAGKSVAQLYVQTPYTEYDKTHGVEKAAIQFLGMEKTEELKPGASQKVTIVVDLKYMGSWDSTAKGGKGGYILDGGDYFFAVGNGAHEAVNNVLVAQGYEVEGDAKQTAKVLVGTNGKVDETTLATSENGTEIVNQLADADVNYYKPGYATYLTRTDWEGTFPRTYDDLTIDGDKVDEWVKNLANEVYQIKKGEAVDIAGMPGDLTLADMAGVTDIDDMRWDSLVRQIPVGTLIAKLVKGGSTVDAIEEIENPKVFQNDGPNGFSSNINSRGAVGEDDPNASFTMATMANEVILGCTFNKDLIREWGELMGNDGLWSGNYMIWGCAANLHRSPFNGRNFEYYSEDAMLSNYMAAATVEGALKYGIIVGPKHLAFNDQETQRSGVAPYMTEQKAREGELRAFQGAMEDAGALGAMTSFSRIGATPVNGSYGVLQAILRQEWGFKGLLSTDMQNNAGFFRPEMCLYAGITMIADFSQNETMEQVVSTWPYFTEELIAQDEELIEIAREDMKYQLYALAQSAAQNIKTINVTPWWETLLNTSIYVCGALSVVFFALYVVSSFAGKKKKEAK